MRINIVDPAEVYAYIILACTKYSYDVLITSEVSTDICDLLIAPPESIKNIKLDLNRVIVYGKDLVRPLREKAIKDVIKERAAKYVNDEDIVVETIKTFGLEALSKPK